MKIIVDDYKLVVRLLFALTLQIALACKIEMFTSDVIFFKVYSFYFQVELIFKSCDEVYWA